MTRGIVDASAALSWMLPSQATEASRAFELRIGEFGLEAPFLMEWEAHNILIKLLRNRRIARTGYEGALQRLKILNIGLAPAFTPGRLAPLAWAAGLSLFDAAYLHHALRSGGALISRDHGLLGVAKANGVSVHDLS